MDTQARRGSDRSLLLYFIFASGWRHVQVRAARRADISQKRGSDHAGNRHGTLVKTVKKRENKKRKLRLFTLVEYKSALEQQFPSVKQLGRV